MKILKNIFGSKPKQNTKYEPNTLAEMNGSPDLRLATDKEKEVDIPLPKNEEVKKISKSSSRSTVKKTSNTAVKSAAEKKVPASSAKTSAQGSASKDRVEKPTATKKTASPSKSTSKESTVKKTTETKKATSTSSTKKVEPKAKSETKKAAVKPATETKRSTAKSAAKPSVEAKKEVKVSSASTKKTDATVKKTASYGAKKTTTASADAKKATKPATDTAKKVTAKKDTTPKDTDIVTESKATRSGKFEIKKSKDGRFVFNLYASNNVIVATSQVYSSSTSAINGIKSVVANAASAQIEDQSLKKVTPVPFPKWEIYQDKGEQYRFRLCASNGSCVVHSQGYTSKANCKKGIESIIKFASDAEITKVYLDKKDK
ncbi:MAG: DUF1508 domain-containing protein [Clostridia bacterium]|nr:DUF1508 domain-containing protein [Clostridia bacterium]